MKNVSKQRFKAIDQMMEDAQKYPLPVRIAMTLLYADHTMEDFIEMSKSKQGSRWNEPVVVNVINAFRDLKRGVIPYKPGVCLKLKD